MQALLEASDASKLTSAMLCRAMLYCLYTVLCNAVLCPAGAAGGV
jgi:hypothetical protein